MIEITSTKNQFVKEAMKLHLKKYREDLILLEGKKAVREGIEANVKIKHIFTLKEEVKGYQNFLVNKDIMEKISTTTSPCEIAAIGYRPVYKFSDFKKFQKIILLDSIKDAGNMGTIIRAACAFGIEGIILYNDTIDEFSPKVIRAAAGNMFKIPIVKANKEDLSELKKTHKFYSSIVNSNIYIENIKIEENRLILFGSEANGLCEELLKLSDVKFTIKMTKNVESLNLALSAGIILYEFNK